MATTVKINRAQYLGNRMLCLTLADGADERAVMAMIDEMQEGKSYAAVIGEMKKKRSLDANAYAWVLMNQLGDKLNKPTVEVYREAIREIGGVSDIVQVREEAAESLIRGWCSRKNGLGWQAERVDAGIIPGVAVVQLWYGSSSYNSKQMHRLLELIIQECSEQGIETMTPGELEKLKGLEDENQ